MKYASRCIPHTLGLSTSIDTERVKIRDWELHLYDSRGLTCQRYSGTERLNAPPPTSRSTPVLLGVRGDIGRRAAAVGVEERGSRESVRQTCGRRVAPN